MSQPLKRLLGAVLQQHAWTLVIAAVYTAVASFLASKLNIWVDEGYTLDTTGRTISYAWKQAIGFEAQPPGYFILMTAWRHIYDSVFFSRVLSIGCTTASVLAAALISKQYLGDRVRPFLLPLLVAAQPLTMLAAVEMRRYALALLLTSCLLILFEKAFPRSGKATLLWRVVYSLAAVVSLYTEYFSGFVLAAQSVLLISRRNSRDLKTQAVSLAFVMLLLAPLVPHIISQVDTYETLHSSSMGQIETTRRFVSYSLDNLITTLWLGPWNRVAKLLMMTAAALCLFEFGRRVTKDRSDSPALEPVILAGVLGVFLVLASFVSAPGFLQPKHFIVVLVPWNLALLSVSTAFRQGAVTCVLTVIIAMNCLATLHEYGHLAKRGDSWRVTRFIERHERQGEPIIVFNAEAALGIQHHYKGVNRIVVIPRSVDYREYDLRRFVLDDESEFWASLQDGRHDTGYYWVVTDSCTDPDSGSCRVGDIDFNCTLFERILKGSFVLLDDVEFFQGRVRFFRHLNTRVPPDGLDQG